VEASIFLPIQKVKLTKLNPIKIQMKKNSWATRRTALSHSTIKAPLKVCFFLKNSYFLYRQDAFYD
jgi:hypothetical protein